MDEIGWMKYLKKCFNYITTFFLCLTVVGLMYDLVTFIFNQDVIKLGNAFGGRLLALFCIYLFFILLHRSVWIIYKIAHAKMYIDFDKEYVRQLTNTNPPAIASLIYDLNTEVYRDYTSTILGLYTKKYINILDFNKGITIKKGLNEDFSKLLKHEIYVYNNVINKERFDEDRFKELIFNDAQENDLIKEVNEKTPKSELLMGCGGLALGLSIVLLSISHSTIFSIFMIILMLISIGYMGVIPFIHNNLVNLDNKYRLTQKGKQELKKIKAFKNFIKDYTLIQEKDIEHVQILEEYIPYSLSLGTSPKVEEYIKQNEVYRNLIYKGKEN